MISLACLLCGLYFEGSLMAVRELPDPPKPYTHWRFDRTNYRNPYGTIAVGYLWEVRSVDLFAELRHESAIGTSQDGGEDSVRAGFRWFPFGRASR